MEKTQTQILQKAQATKKNILHVGKIIRTTTTSFDDIEGTQLARIISVEDCPELRVPTITPSVVVIHI